MGAFSIKVTTNGSAAAAGCMTAQIPLIITRAAFGSGAPPNGTNLANVHSLYRYVADGTVADRRRVSNFLLLTPQYSNMANPDIPTFTATELMVYCRNPNTGEETDFLYGYLDEESITIPQYTTGSANGIFNFPLKIIVSSNLPVQVRASPGLVTYSELIRLLDSGGIGTSVHNITIPAADWISDTDTNGEYALMRDISLTGCKSQMVPQLLVPPGSDMALAKTAELAPYVQTLSGKFRIYAKRAPAADINAALTLAGMQPYIRILYETSDGVLIDMADLEQLDLLGEQVQTLEQRTTALENAQGSGSGSSSGNGSVSGSGSGSGSGTVGTGIASFGTSGNGNAVTAVSFDPNTGAMTVTMGATFLTADQIATAQQVEDMLDTTLGGGV